MMANEFVLFTVSVLPVLLIARYIYIKDRQKEPKRLLLKLFLGGIGSCFLVGFITVILDLIFPIMSYDVTSMNYRELFLYVFLGIALVEEACKWIMVYKISYNDNAFDELYDAILYGMFVALGFACFENLAYVYEGGIGTGIARGLLSVPGHACFGMFMGYFLGLSKISMLNGRVDLKNKNMALSIVIPTILHGIYDYCLFSGKIVLLIIFFVFVVFMYKQSLKRIKKVSLLNDASLKKAKYCGNCGRVVEGNYCSSCGRKHI